MSRERWLAALLPSVAALALGGAASAEDDYARDGFYLVAGVAFATPTELEGDAQHVVDAFTPDGEIPQSVRTDARIGVDVRVGYRFHPRVAAEAQVQWIDGFTATIDDNKNVYRGYTVVAGLNAKGYILTGRFQPFVLLGGAYFQTSVKVPENGVVPASGFDTARDGAFRVGVGFDAYFTENWAFTLGADYIHTTGNASEARNVNVALGAMYRF